MRELVRVLSLLLFFSSPGVMIPTPAIASPIVSSGGVVEIPHPELYSQVLALSDVHGMYAPLLRLLTQAGLIDPSRHWKAGKTLLIIVGDSIDKGPQSVDVIDLWMALAPEAEKAGGAVVHLLGNHEAEFLAYGKNDSKSETLLEELKQKGMKVRELRDATEPRGKYLHAMPAAAKVGRWLFCHAGFFPEMSWADFSKLAGDALKADRYEDDLLIGDDSLLEAKDWWAKPKNRRKYEDRLSLLGFYGVVQGHQPKAYEIEGRIGAIDGGKLVKLDNGMAPVAGAAPGSLLRIGNPSEMSELKTPKFEVIDSNGKVKALEIE